MKILKLMSFIAITLFSHQLFSAGMEEVCSYRRDMKDLPVQQQFEKVRYDAQFIKCMAGFDAKPNAQDFMDKGIKACYFYQRPDHRPAFKGNVVPCVKLICDSFRTVMDDDCKNYNTKPKRPEHNKNRL